jgi:hypothetical protein
MHYTLSDGKKFSVSTLCFISLTSGKAGGLKTVNRSKRYSRVVHNDVSGNGPERAKQQSPGRKPWDIQSYGTQPCKGRTGRLCRPYRALLFRAFSAEFVNSHFRLHPL